MNDALSRLVTALGNLLSPIADAAADTTRFVSLLSDLGYALPGDLQTMPHVAGVSSLADHLDDLDELVRSNVIDEQHLDTISAAIATDILDVVFGLGAVETSIRNHFSNVPNFSSASRLNELPRRLIDHLVIKYLEEQYPTVHAILETLGFLESFPVEEDATTFQSAHMANVVYWERLKDIITNPSHAFSSAYSTGVNFRTSLLLERIQNVGVNLGIPVDLDYPHDNVLAAINPARVSGDDELALTIPFLVRPDLGLEVEFEICPLYSDDGGISGIAVVLFVDGNPSATSFSLSEDLVLQISTSLQLNRGLGVVIRSHLPNGVRVEFLKDIYSQNPLDTGDLSIEAKARKASHTNKLTMIFGDEASSHLGIGGYGFRINLAQNGDNREITTEIELKQFTLAIASDKADGFLEKILSGININTSCDLVFGYSNLRGVYFGGSGALEITIPIHKSISPIKLNTVYIALGVDGGIEIKLAVSFGFELGPIAGSVDRIGLGIPIKFPDNQSGNLGPVDIEAPNFLDPTGVGLAINAGGITGGGFLDFKDKEYAGILQLKFGEIGLTAIGLINTKLPDGSDGFAMLVIIGVEFNPPIQLSFGFTLSGVGGLIGVNRTMVLEALRDGLRNRTLDSILFPEDAINNAPKIISDLRAVFPPEDGRFIVGPMVKIGWGTPNMITADLAVIIELPSPVRLAILGQIVAKIPSDEIEVQPPIVILNIDVLGTIEFAKKFLAIDATLYDSRILAYPLTGDAALRLKWGDNPQFAMSLGGFHPKFTPPPNFPTLRRLKLSLGSGDNPRINCDQYKALTSNSLQFGARLEIYGKFKGAKIKGHLGYDALFYFSPFSFEAMISGGVSVRYKGRKVAGIRLFLSLSGPTPWHVTGKAKFEILWWDVKVRFSKTWGPRNAATLPAIDPWPDFITALRHAGAWGSVLPEGQYAVESLRSLEEKLADASEGGTVGSVEEEVSDGQEDSTSGSVEEETSEDSMDSPPPLRDVIAHPAGKLEIRQKVVPLGIRLSRYGNAPVASHHTFDLEGVEEPSDQDANSKLEYSAVTGYFARGQFENLSNSEKVAKPSFELFKDGVAIHVDTPKFQTGLIEENEVEYESEYIDEDYLLKKPDDGRPKARLHHTLVYPLLRGAAVRKSKLLNTERRKYAPAIQKPLKVALKTEGFAIVNAADLTIVSEIMDGSKSLTRMEADHKLKDLIKENPAMKDKVFIVSTHEVAA